ncbi:ABC transporter substrate-binding protein [Bacillus sp. REN10]|uniref:ABC transporter substrate-binding protein n=1 Tax=Bacillus sp. REN10 TaxID=2782541 RepID=UPI00193BE47C|nr:ABC transporter substrate-binding protein [Bacillus sp. REN10]
MRKLKQSVFASIVVLLLSIMTACNQSASPTEKPSDKNTETTEPITIENMDRTITFEEAPKRAVTLNQHTTEIMLALGLEDSMVGTAYLDDEILPEYKEAYGKIKVLSDKYPSQEVFLEVESDFAYAGWQSAFTDKTLGTVEQLEQFGVKSYLQQSSNMSGPTMDDVFTDILNIGRIFRVEDRAETLVQNMKEEMNAVQEKVKDVEEPIHVFVYDSGEKEPTTAGQNFLNELITLAGGSNIFNDIEKGWASASWEEVVNRNPEIIVIVDYGDTTIDQKREFLVSHPALKDVEAIKNKRFVTLPLSAGAEGVRGPIAIETLAKAFYPDQF